MTVQENSRQPAVYSIMFNSFGLKMILWQQQFTLRHIDPVLCMHKIIQFAQHGKEIKMCRKTIQCI